MHLFTWLLGVAMAIATSTNQITVAHATPDILNLLQTPDEITPEVRAKLLEFQTKTNILHGKGNPLNRRTRTTAVPTSRRFHASPINANGPVINTTYGAVEGTYDTVENVQVATFLGIPFAAPPIGQNRFRQAQPPTSWTGIYDATSAQSECAQGSPWSILDHNKIDGDEDCLYLDVFVPAADLSERLPVMFWIYGGGYITGDDYENGRFDGSYLAAKYGVIIVAANYRLGPFGFMALSELRQEDAYGSSGNIGVRDQTFALQWVQKNIARFGGDKSQVTIFGQSAGGFSVCWHLVNQASAGLFQRAIMESGSCDSPQFFQKFELAEKWSRAFAAQTGCKSTGEELLQCLRKLSAIKLQNAPLVWNGVPSKSDNASADGFYAPYLSPLYPIMPWGPAIDGTNVGLLATPYLLLSKGKFNQVPVIFGSNLNEGTMFAMALPVVAPIPKVLPPTVPAVKQALRTLFGVGYHGAGDLTAVNDLIPLLVEKYHVIQNGSWLETWDNFNVTAHLITEYFFACGIRRSARAIASHKVPVYLYRFDYKVPNSMEYDLLGDYHGAELPFVWASSDVRSQPITGAMNTYWTNFAKYGNPNGDSLRQNLRHSSDPLNTYMNWPEYDPSNAGGTNIIFDWPLQSQQNMLNDICNFWDDHFDIANHPWSAL